MPWATRSLSRDWARSSSCWESVCPLASIAGQSVWLVSLWWSLEFMFWERWCFARRTRCRRAGTCCSTRAIIVRDWHSSEAKEGAPVEAYAPPKNFDARSVFVIGVIHGLGAETPSQLMIFLLAANLGGAALGMLGPGNVPCWPVDDECSDDRIGSGTIWRVAAPSAISSRCFRVDGDLQPGDGHHLPVRPRFVSPNN